MSDPYSELGGRAETYEEALARCIVLRPAAAKTEAEIAADIVASRERMRVHDAYFSMGFISNGEAQMVSREVARQWGHFINEPDDDRPGGDD